MCTDTALFMLGSKVEIVFDAYMGAATKFIMQTANARDVGCTKFNDDVMRDMNKMAEKIEEYKSNPMQNDGIGGQIGIVTASLQKEIKRLKNAEKQQRSEKKRKADAVATVAEDDPHDDKFDLLVGIGIANNWSEVVFESVGDINATDMEYFADSIYQHGSLSFDLVKQLGYQPRGKKKKTWHHLLDQLLKTLPIFAIRLNRSRHVVLLDGKNLNEALVLNAITSVSAQTKTPGEKVEAQALQQEAEEHAKDVLESDVELWDKLGDEEFIENVCVEQVEGAVKRVEQKSISAKLKQYPNILEHIKEILTEHGAQAAQGRRRDDKAHTIALGTRRVREILHQEYGEDAGHVTIWRFFKCARVTDRRSIREGGRYQLLDTSTTTVRNSQFVSPHSRGQWCAAQVRDVHECFAQWEYELGEKCILIPIDNMAKLPCVVDATSHMFGRNRGTTWSGDSRNQYDHNTVVANKLLVETTGAVLCKPAPYKQLTDALGRPRLPRCRAFGMCDYIRGVPFTVKDTAQACHFRDIRKTLLTLLN